MKTVDLDKIASSVAVDGALDYPVEFSFCTLMTKPDQYHDMVASMVAAGFDPSCAEFLYLDNTAGNQGDGYGGLNRLANAAKGRFIIFCHQDILGIDGPDRLRQVVSELNQTDPNWAVLGNAGLRGGERFMYLSESATVFASKTRQPSQQVDSLDEDFLLLRQDARLGFSRDLEGFHLYGTDLVVQAGLRGLTAYVADFRVEHIGVGLIDQTFHDACDRFEEKYARAFATRTVSTTCTALDLGTLNGKGRERRHLNRERGLDFVRPSKKIKKAIRTTLSKNTIELDGMIFQHPEDVTYVAYHALRKGLYELPERNLMKKHLPADLPVVELGGSYGIVSGLINRKLDRDKAQVIVEANPQLLDLCRANAQRGGAERDIRIVNCAIDYSGADSITFNVTSGTHDSHVVESWREAQAGSTITVPTMTLAQLLAAEGIDEPYALVCDIEGAEFDLMANEATGLDQCQAMIVELHPSVFYERNESVSSFVRHLDRAGFEVVANEATVVAAQRKAT